MPHRAHFNSYFDYHVYIVKVYVLSTRYYFYNIYNEIETIKIYLRNVNITAVYLPMILYICMYIFSIDCVQLKSFKMHDFKVFGASQEVSGEILFF